MAILVRRGPPPCAAGHPAPFLRASQKWLYLGRIGHGEMGPPPHRHPKLIYTTRFFRLDSLNGAPTMRRGPPSRRPLRVERPPSYTPEASGRIEVSRPAVSERPDSHSSELLQKASRDLGSAQAIGQ